MPEEPVDLHLLLKELREIKQLIKEDLELDRKDLGLDESEMRSDEEIMREQKVLEQKTGAVAANLSGMRYVSLDIWRRMIWENCESRKSNTSEREITYDCALYGGPCKFEVCPKNIALQKKS